MDQEQRRVELRAQDGTIVRVAIPRECAEQIGQSLELMQLSTPVDVAPPPQPPPPPPPTGH